MNHVRVIVTETDGDVTVARVIQGRSKKNVEQRTRQQIQSIIEQVLQDNPQAYCDDMDEVMQHGYWWTDLGHEVFTVMVLEPEHVDRAGPLVVEIDLEGGMISHAKMPHGVRVVVRDYDTDGVELDRLHRDNDGRTYTQTNWSSDDTGTDALTAPCGTATKSALKDGFIILTHNAGSDPSEQFEAWAYQGPLNFEKAHPLRFGIGDDFTEALSALEDQLQQLNTAV